MEAFVKENKFFEIVVASQKTEDITADLYQQLLHLLEYGNDIREYTQVYENKTQRIPVHYIARDFYKFFPFNRSNSNKLYLLNVTNYGNLNFYYWIVIWSGYSFLLF